MSAVEDLIEGLVVGGLVLRSELSGCSSAEIEEIRIDQGVPAIPAEYERYLRLAGRGAGALLRGSDAFFPALLGLKCDTAALLDECGADVSLAADSLVIAMHQGYQAFWIPAVGAQKPEVVMFQEGAREICRRWGGVADYLETMASAIRC